MTNEDLAWAAGFFDGEGHIGFIVHNNKRINGHLHIQICQTEDGPLQRFYSVFGVGKIYGPYTPKTKRGNRRPYKQFHVDRADHVKMIISSMWSWLSNPKQRQAKAALDAYEAYQKIPNLKTGPKTNINTGPSSCHPNRPSSAKGLCESCYRKDLKNRNE